MNKRNEYPRPSMRRESFISLSGKWQFECEEAGICREIEVPFCPESVLSGIGYTGFMKNVRYSRSVTLQRICGKRLLIHFDGVDYFSRLYVNGNPVGEHTGGQTAFSFDITDFITDGENMIELAVTDDLLSGRQPAGKQSTREYSYGCVYTRTTGIYRPVWLEYVPDAHVASLRLTPDIDRCELECTVFCENADGEEVLLEASYLGKEAGKVSAKVRGKCARATLHISDLHLWEIGNGRLYGLTVTLKDDRVESYFAMRSVYAANGGLYLNNKPLFMRLVLDQGYYPGGVMTPEDTSCYRDDIAAAMSFGFNGARYHQRTPEDTYLYEADKAGFIVHCEFGNCGLDLSSDSAWRGMFAEWQDVVTSCYNHPCVAAWCPLNETAENRQGLLVKALYDITRAIDPVRPILDVSGFFHEKGVGDIEDSHDYHQEPRELEEVYLPLAEGRSIDYMNGHGRPAFVSEFGGCRYGVPEGVESYGYGASGTEEEFCERFKGLTEALLKNPVLAGFCYTQLYDIEQERNGLMTFEREFKLDPALLQSFTAAPSEWEKKNNK